MKTLLAPLLIWLTTVCSQAQVTVMLLKDTARYQVSRETLNRDYRPIQTLLASQPAVVAKYRIEQFDRLNTFILKQANLPKRGLNLFLNAYYEPNGKAKWVLVEPFEEMPDSTQQRVLQLLTDFYGSTPFSVGSTVPFSYKSAYFIGQPAPPKRSVRTGAGTIASVEAARHTTRPDTVTKLFFNQLSLTTIPEEVYRFPNLEELDLSKNSIKHLPARLTTDLPKLKRLSLLFNQLTDDSVSFSCNKHLVALNIQGNHLTQIPASTRKNRRLESLWIGNNKLASVHTKGLRRLNNLNLYNAGLVEFPKQIARLKRLKILDLYYNSFTTLPERIGRLRSLEQLAISHNKLKELPASLGRLRNLTTVFAHHNQLSQLPETLPRLPRLKTLDIGYNWFSVVPDALPALTSLEELDLSNNNLQELPASLTKLTHLKKLYLRQNPFLRSQALTGTSAQLIDQLEANRTEVFH